MALTDGGVSPEQVGYINAHGTSTHLNDAGETAAVKTVFGPPRLSAGYELHQVHDRTYAAGAAGYVEAIFTALSLRDGFLPAIHYQTPDPDCDLDVVPNEGRPAGSGSP